MYGTQALIISQLNIKPFENDVKMYGTQAYSKFRPTPSMFENDVKMYGTQATPLNITF